MRDMSRLRRPTLSDRFFCISRRVFRSRRLLNEDELEILAKVMRARRAQHGFQKGPRGAQTTRTSALPCSLEGI